MVSEFWDSPPVKLLRTPAGSDSPVRGAPSGRIVFALDPLQSRNTCAKQKEAPGEPRSSAALRDEEAPFLFRATTNCRSIGSIRERAFAESLPEPYRSKPMTTTNLCAVVFSFSSFGRTSLVGGEGRGEEAIGFGSFTRGPHPRFAADLH